MCLWIAILMFGAGSLCGICPGKTQTGARGIPIKLLAAQLRNLKCGMLYNDTVQAIGFTPHRKKYSQDGVTYMVYYFEEYASQVKILRLKFRKLEGNLILQGWDVRTHRVRHVPSPCLTCPAPTMLRAPGWIDYLRGGVG